MGADIDFELELVQLLDQWAEADIETSWMRRRIGEIGAIAAAREYVLKNTPGFGRAYQVLGRDYTLEALVVRFRELFDEEIVSRAQAKLDEMGAAS